MLEGTSDNGQRDHIPEKHKNNNASCNCYRNIPNVVFRKKAKKKKW